MITIYHVPSSRSQRIVWLMEEMEEPYALEKFGIPVPDSFLAVNPLGSVPTIVDDDADAPITMFESIAILLYITGRRLVAGNERAIALAVGPRPDAAHYAHHLQFLHFGEADLATPIGTIFRTRVFSVSAAQWLRAEAASLPLAACLGGTRCLCLSDWLARRHCMPAASHHQPTLAPAGTLA